MPIAYNDASFNDNMNQTTVFRTERMQISGRIFYVFPNIVGVVGRQTINVTTYR